MDERWDVVVLGGGSAGLAAGIAAARAGAKTLLVERHGFLGGMATAALVHSVCGLYRLRDKPGVVYASAGFPRQFADRLIDRGASPGPVRLGRLDVLPHHPAGFACVADELTVAEPNLSVWFHAEVFAVRESSGSVEFEWICRGNRGRAQAAALVDGSGDGVAAVLAGYDVDQAPANRLQRPAYIFGVAGLKPEWVEPEDGRLRLAHFIVEAVRRGELPEGALAAQFRTVGSTDETFCTVDLEAEAAAFDPLDPALLARLERQGRAIAQRLVAHLGARLTQFPARVGIRESRRVMTEHCLTGDELLRAEPFGDGIALATWPMELRETVRGAKWRFPKGDRPPRIPLRSLTVRGSRRIWVAGRCLGADHEAQAAIRVMGTCLATGEAAGIAAALRAGQQEVCATELRKRLEWGEP